MTTINILKPSEHSLKQLDESGLVDSSVDLIDTYNHLIINDSSCQILSVEMPVKQTRQIIKALPFALEEQLANDIDENHLHYLGKEGGLAFALIIQQVTIETIIDQYNPDKLLYLPNLLPLKDNTISVCILDGTASIRQSKFSGMSVAVEILPLVLERLKTEQLNQIDIYDFDKSNELITLELENLGFVVNQENTETLLENISQQININDANLISGTYQKKKAKTETKLTKFKAPAAIAAALVICVFAINFKQMNQYNQMADLVKQSSKNFYGQLFPDERVRSIKRQFKDKLDEADGGFTTSDGFIHILGSTTKEIQEIGTIEWDAVRFTRKKNELELNLVVSNIAQLDNIKTKLINSGLQVDIASATETGSKIKGVLKVKQNG